MSDFLIHGETPAEILDGVDPVLDPEVFGAITEARIEAEERQQ